MSTNAQFSETKQFLEACQEAGIPATARQASKFQNQKGLTFKLLTRRIKILKGGDGKFIKIINQLS